METGVDLLYYYTKIDRFLFENLINGTMIFNNPKSFNDPFDCMAPAIYQVESDEKILREYYHYFSDKNLNDYVFNLKEEDFIFEWIKNPSFFEERLHTELIESNRQEIGIMCLSKMPDKIKMWSHYAAKHQGVCVQIDVSKDIIKGANNICNVNYPPDKAYQNFLDKSVSLIENFLGQLITKSPEWKEEEEVRILVQPSGLHEINRDCLRTIIFGVNTPLEERKTLKELIKKLDYPNLRFAKTRLSKVDFAILIDDDPS